MNNYLHREIDGLQSVIKLGTGYTMGIKIKNFQTNLSLVTSSLYWNPAAATC